MTLLLRLHVAGLNLGPPFRKRQLSVAWPGMTMARGTCSKDGSANGAEVPPAPRGWVPALMSTICVHFDNLAHLWRCLAASLPVDDTLCIGEPVALGCGEPVGDNPASGLKLLAAPPVMSVLLRNCGSRRSCLNLEMPPPATLGKEICL